MVYRLCLAVCLAALQLQATGALAEVSFQERLAEGQPPAVSAHRSAYMNGFPENSLAWIQDAIDRGIDIIHINPQVTADDAYVLMHDHTLNRTTDVESAFPDGVPGGPTREERWGKDYVRDYTSEQLQSLKIVNGEDGGSHHVPSLGDALDLADGKILVRIGLKSYEVDSLATALRGYEPSSLILFELFRSDTEQSKLRELSEATGIGVSVALLGPKEALDDLNDIAGIEIDTEAFDFETLGGLILDLSGSIPAAGDVFTYHGIRITVRDVDNRRIRTADVLVTGIESSTTGNEG